MGDRFTKMKDGMSQAPKVHIKKFFSAARKQVTAAKRQQNKGKTTGGRLYVKGVVAGFKGSLAKQYNHTNLIKIEGVEDSKDVQFYLGKRIMYICRAKGTSGIVRAKFKKNLPPSALGAPVRIMLFP